MTKLCRNGHDLSLHGKYMQVGASMYRRCTACLRATRVRMNSRRREKRRNERAANPRPATTTCRNGHSIETYRKYLKNGKPVCKKCVSDWKKNWRKEKKK